MRLTDEAWLSLALAAGAWCWLFWGFLDCAGAM